MTNNNRIRKIDLKTNTVTTFTGSGASGSTDGFGIDATFSNPNGVSISPNGKYALVCDIASHTIRKIILSTAEVTTFAGLAAASGNVNDIETNARFFNPREIDISSDGTFALISEAGNRQIRKIIISTREVSLVAGLGIGYANGIGTNAQFTNPSSISLSHDQTYALVGDSTNHHIRKLILSTAEVTLFVGGGATEVASGNGNGFGTNVGFNTLNGITISPTGRSALVTDTLNARLCKIQILPPPIRPALR